MDINPSLYLAQSYQDAWSEYTRSLLSNTYPTWDYIFLTASNDHQAEGYQRQLKARSAFLPKRSKFVVIPDKDGVRIGSGGATLSVLKYIREHEPSFEGLRVLVIHSGGDSKRVPQYSALGKLFSPVPHKLPDGRSSTLFDEFIIGMAGVPSRIREGMLLLSGDVILLFNPLLIDYSGHGAAVISFKEDVETGKDHGVYLRGDDGSVRRFLHKQSMEMLRAVGAVNDANTVDIDTGAVIFGVDVLNALYGLISEDGVFTNEKFDSLVNEKVRLSLYGDFQYPMATDSTLEQFYLEKPEGEYSLELKDAREKVWDVLHKFSMKLLRLAPAKFIHFGTSGEILKLMNSQIRNYAILGWERAVNCSMDERAAGYNSVLSPRAEIGKNCYLEVTYAHSGASIGNECILSYIDIHKGDIIPDKTIMHGLKQSNGRFVVRIYGIDDNPKGNALFGQDINAVISSLGIDPTCIWGNNDDHTLWNARLFPTCFNIREAVKWALLIHRIITTGDHSCVSDWLGQERKSLCEGFNDADVDAILAWNSRMSELVQMNDISALIDARLPATDIKRPLGDYLTPIQQQWLEEHLQRANYSEAMRLHYYIGSAMSGINGEKEMRNMFSTLRNAILNETLPQIPDTKRAKICKDELTVALPLRVNWGGGWSDTPPYCNENGGTVLNAAILLNNTRPVTVTLRRLQELKIVFDSRDMDVHGEYSSIEKLQTVGDPFDPFVLQKAALLACGLIPAEGGTLDDILTSLGGGFFMNTEVTGVPKGSGLGTSSILAAACIKALNEFLNLEYTYEDLYSRVLCMEQIMSTGGGWQDQVGGLTDGVKYITSRPGLRQKLSVQHIVLDASVKKELNSRFTLIYTGQRRLARHLLRDVIGRYVGNTQESLYALNEIQRTAALMKFELERGHLDAFAELMNEHWRLSKIIDKGSTNTLIEQIFSSVDDLLDGKMICGAGGGGFLQVLLKRDVTREMLQNRLKSVFQDTDIREWECTLI